MNFFFLQISDFQKSSLDTANVSLLEEISCFLMNK